MVLEWDSIRQWEIDEEGMAFCLKYNRQDKTPRWLKIFTIYVSSIPDCRRVRPFSFNHFQMYFAYDEYFQTL